MMAANVLFALAWWGLVPLQAPGTTPDPMVYPTQGSGFAAWIVGGFFGLGILVLFMIWTSRRPKRPS
jgi:hypothetical protein